LRPLSEFEKSGGIFDQKLLPARGIRRVERDQIDDLAIVGHAGTASAARIMAS
jgi:hypothetical protein